MVESRQDISVVICAYTEDRWQELLAAIASIKNQALKPREIIVVIDHNPALFERVARSVEGVVLVENRQAQGLSGARNSGIAAAKGNVIAFMDEDAVAAPDCLAQLYQEFKHPDVMGVGGASLPLWEKDRPLWLPEEFYWVVGCSYRGMPESTAPVRNLIGCNMAFRREVFTEVGSFRNGMGRIGTNPVGCEETELCIRAGQHWPKAVFLYKPSALVYHHVPQKRTRMPYFLSRCYSEGISKAMVSRFVGAGDGLASERQYTFRTLPLGVIRGILDTLSKRSVHGLARSAAILAGLATTTAGYLRGRLAMLLSNKHPKNGSGQLASENPGFRPVRLLEIELSRPLKEISPFDPQSGRRYARGLAFVFLHHQPLGNIELDLGESGLDAGETAIRIWQRLGTQINQHVRSDGLDPVTGLDASGIPAYGIPACLQTIEKSSSSMPLASVVICTRDHPESLAACLESFRSLEYPNYEIILVDNAPATDATRELVKNSFWDLSQLRYVRENQPGLSAARNRGLAEAMGEVIAFTDDDVIVDHLWLKNLVLGFSHSGKVACVTGLVLPGEIETPAQAMMEQFGGMGKGFERQTFDLADHRPNQVLYPFTAGSFGVGANMAYKTGILRCVGGFDPALGTGTPAAGGEDLAMFFNLVIRGYQIVYEPGAFIYHFHRRTYAAFQKQAYAYGIGLTSYLTKVLVDRPYLLLDVALKIPAGVWYLVNRDSPKNKKKQANYPPEINRLERKGMLLGPLSYFRSRRWARTYERRFGTRQMTAASSPYQEGGSNQ